MLVENARKKTLSWRKKVLRLGLVPLGGLVVLAGLWWCFVPRHPLLDGVAFSAVILDRNGSLLRLGLSRDHVFRVRTRLEDMAPDLVEATLLYEDRRFYSHLGVNPLALLRAFHATYLGGGRRMGASTITMQLARLRYGLNTSTVWGKLRQMERALALERHYSKKEILEAYLNLAPYGGNIEGAGAAALIYFRTKAASLTLAESLALAGVPQNPARRNPVSAAKESRQNLAAARERLSRIWLEVHPEDADNAFFHSLPLAAHSVAELPFRAPHVTAEALLRDDGTGETILTTLDARAQDLLEFRIRTFTRRRGKEGLNNACGLLLHWPSMEIRALAGSADFHNIRIQGEVDGTRALRSPGSTLKPFIYALALDQGLIHPRTLLYDTPQNFKGYEPDNADQRFRGPIPAADALLVSRNIPAINLANRLARPDLYEFLQKAHLNLPKKREEYGLSLVLGGAETSPRRLAALYALLANRGVWKEPVLFRTGASAKEWNGAPDRAASGSGVSPDTALLSPEAAALTLDMLRDNPAARRVRYIGLNTPRLPAYWKTGTSNGNRDAWAAGVFGPYVLVVWVGNFDGRPNPALTGAGAAGELFLDAAGALAIAEPLRDTVLAHMDGLNLTRVPVCADTGDINTALCPETVTTWFIPGVSPVADTGIYRRVLVDTATGLRTCVEEEGRTRSMAFAFWPSDMQEMFRRAGVGKKPPPPLDPLCLKQPEAAAGKGPHILSPKEGLTYYRSLANPDSGRLALTAGADAEVSRLFWFSGRDFIGSAPPGEPLYWTPPGGVSSLRVLDSLGRSTTRVVKVEMRP